MFDAPAPTGRAGLTTPDWLRRAMAAVLVLAVLAGGAALWAAAGIRDVAQTIGHDAEPSVALALQIAGTLSDMDAAVLADSLTDNGAAAGTSARYGDDVRQLADALVQSAQNITYGEREAAPLRALEQELVAYEQAVVESRYIGQGDALITLRRVQWASRVDREMAIPEAAALAKANADVLEQRYAAYRATSLLRGAAGFVAFAVLAAVLLGVQVWLARRVRRLVNPGLAAATLLVAASGLWFGATVLAEREDLRAAKNDAYDSLHVLYTAQQAANALRAGMSLWLLDPAARAGAQADMDAASHDLVARGLGQPLLAQLRAALQLEREGHPAAALQTAPHPGGLLGAELDNVTYGAPERSAATDSVARLLDAEALIRAVQARDVPGQHTLAVGQWLSAAPGGGAAAFAALREAIGRTIAINQGEFDRDVAAALRSVATIPLLAGSLMIAVALAWGGLWLRLREYR